MFKKILIIFGTRPEAIKMCPLVHQLKISEQFDVRVCVTAQHRQMLDQVLQLFEIYPEYDLNIMKPGQGLHEITSNILLGLHEVLGQFQPDLVCVHGDTTTTLAASLAAYYHKIPVAHIEAGLRTHNPYSPWPEEINRKLTGHIAQYHFAPTEASKNNLLKEGISSDAIIITGNTVIDALQWVIKKLNNNEDLREQLKSFILLKGYSFGKRPYILITGHRRENFGQGFFNICTAIKEVAKQNPGFDFVYPVHLNPNVQSIVKEVLAHCENIYLLDPLDYLPFVFLMKECYFILTDSGGIQEEAPSLGKPVLVTRNTTERPEALVAGTIKLVGVEKNSIVKNMNELMTQQNIYQNMTNANNPYGDGKACERIVKFLAQI